MNSKCVPVGHTILVLLVAVVGMFSSSCSESPKQKLAMIQAERELNTAKAEKAKAELALRYPEIFSEEVRANRLAAAELQDKPKRDLIDGLGSALYTDTMARAKALQKNVETCQADLDNYTSKLAGVEDGLRKLGLAEEWRKVKAAGTYSDHESSVGAFINLGLEYEQLRKQAEVRLATAKDAMAGKTSK